ncbi:hypothetical protein R6Q59_015471 [Mikania micrantha]|nr:hypothetical protein E3N88_08332 [Mikania micrantha]
MSNPNSYYVRLPKGHGSFIDLVIKKNRNHAAEEIAGGRRIARRLAEIEEKEIEKSLKKVDKKANRVSIPVPKVTEAKQAEILKKAEEEKRRQS